MAPRTVVAGIGVAIVLLAIVIGLAVIGSPADERARRLDERRVRALQGLAGAVDEYWRVRGRVPQSIAELMRDPSPLVRSTPRKGPAMRSRTRSWVSGP